MKSQIILPTLICIAGFTSAHAQTPESPAPTPVPAATDQEVGETALADDKVSVDSAFGYIRVWVMIPEEIPAEEFGAVPKLKDSLYLSYQTADGTTDSLISNPYPFMMGGYRDVPPGKRSLQLSRKNGEETEQLATLELDIEPSSFTTVTIAKKNASYNLEAFRDSQPEPEGPATDSPPNKTSKRITCYNFLQGAKVTVRSEDPILSIIVPNGEPVVIPDLPSKIFTLFTTGSYDGKAFSGQSEIDFSSNDSLSYVIIQDIYGRTLPSLLPSGKLD